MNRNIDDIICNLFTLFIIDFGLNFYYIENGKHVPDIEGRRFIGAQDYSPRHNIDHFNLCRRGAVESILLLVYSMVKMGAITQKHNDEEPKELKALKENCLIVSFVDAITLHSYTFLIINRSL